MVDVLVVDIWLLSYTQNNRDNDLCFSGIQFCHLLNNEKGTSSGKVFHKKDHIKKHKGYSYLYEGDQEEDEEEFMAAMCHNGKIKVPSK